MPKAAGKAETVATCGLSRHGKQFLLRMRRMEQPLQAARCRLQLMCAASILLARGQGKMDSKDDQSQAFGWSRVAEPRHARRCNS